MRFIKFGWTWIDAAKIRSVVVRERADETFDVWADEYLLGKFKQAEAAEAFAEKVVRRIEKFIIEWED